jgi:hypothetical protein
VKLLAGGDRRLWLAVGVVAGIGLENKDTLLFLGAGLAVGLVLARRWDVVRSPWAWAAIGIALLLWAPNLAWQAANGWPQLTMAQAISQYAADNRGQIVPLLWLFTGPFLFPVSAAGLVWVLRTKAAAPWRPIGIAALVALALVVVSGGKAYYAIGSVPLFMAAGRSSGPLAGPWPLPRQGRELRDGRRALGCPHRVPDPADPAARHVCQVVASRHRPRHGERGRLAAVRGDGGGRVAALPADQRAHAVILTNDYSEASPLDLLGTGLPAGLLGPQLVLGLGTPAGRPHSRRPRG